MRIISRRTLRIFVESRRSDPRYVPLKGAIDAWFEEARRARWHSMADVKRQYRNASIIDAERIVLNSRATTTVWSSRWISRKSAIWIKWLGTHRDYDRIDARTIEHGR